MTTILGLWFLAFISSTRWNTSKHVFISLFFFLTLSILLSPSLIIPLLPLKLIWTVPFQNNPWLITFLSLAPAPFCYFWDSFVLCWCYTVVVWESSIIEGTGSIYNICIYWWYLDIMHWFKNKNTIYLEDRGTFGSSYSICIASFLCVALLLTH